MEVHDDDGSGKKQLQDVKADSTATTNPSSTAPLVSEEELMQIDSNASFESLVGNEDFPVSSRNSDAATTPTSAANETSTLPRDGGDGAPAVDLAPAAKPERRKLLRRPVASDSAPSPQTPAAVTPSGPGIVEHSPAVDARATPQAPTMSEMKNKLMALKRKREEGAAASPGAVATPTKTTELASTVAATPTPLPQTETPTAATSSPAKLLNTSAPATVSEGDKEVAGAKTPTAAQRKISRPPSPTKSNSLTKTPTDASSTPSAATPKSKESSNVKSVTKASGAVLDPESDTTRHQMPQQEESQKQQGAVQQEGQQQKGVQETPAKKISSVNSSESSPALSTAKSTAPLKVPPSASTSTPLVTSKLANQSRAFTPSPFNATIDFSSLVEGATKGSASPMDVDISTPAPASSSTVRPTFGTPVILQSATPSATFSFGTQQQKQPTLPTEATTITAPSTPSSIAALGNRISLGVGVAARNEQELQRLRDRVVELEREKALREVDDEAVAKRFENEIKGLREAHAAVTAAKEAEKIVIENLNKSLEAEQRSSATVKEKLEGTVREVARLKSQIDTLEADKRGLAVVISGKLEEHEISNREISRLRSELQTSRDEVTRLNSVVSHMQSDEVRTRLERSTQDQQGEQYRRNAEWLDGELKRKDEDFKKYRKEKGEIISKLQLDIESVSQERNTFQIQATSLKEKADNFEKRLYDMTDKVKELESRLISDAQSFRNEMNAQRHISDLFESQAKDYRTQVEELRKLVVDMEAGMNDLDERRVSAERKLSEETNKFTEHSSALRLQVQTLEIRVKEIDDAAQKEVLKLDILSPAAQAASALQKSGKTFTEVFAEYSVLQDENLRSKREIMRLNETLQGVLDDLRERTPIFTQTMKDKQALEKEVERLNDEVGRLTSSHREVTAKVKVAEAEIRSLETKNKILTQESYDLSRQVQALLGDLELLRAGPAGLTRLELGEDPAADSASQSVVSERLVVFHNIMQLQEQNVQLRNTARNCVEELSRLKSEMDAKFESEMAAAMETVTKDLTEITEELRTANLKAETYMRERDQWQRIAQSRGAGALAGTAGDSPGRLNSRPGTPARKEGGTGSGAPTPGGTVANDEYRQLYQDLQREFDSYRRETGTDTKTLREENEAMRTEKSDLAIQVARLNSTATYHNERYLTLSQNSEQLTKENNQLRERISSLVNSLTAHDLKAQELANQLVEIRSQLETTTTDLRQLRGERDVLRSGEARMVAENKGLIEQRNMANEHLRTLQRMFDEQERQSKEISLRNDEKAARLEKEIDLVRHQLATALDEARSLTLRRETESREAQLKIERLTSELATAVRDCDVAKAEERALNARIEDLTAKLAAAEEKAKASAETSLLEEAGVASGTINNVRELRIEISQLKADLDLANESLQLERARVEQYKAISAATEEKLIEFSASYDAYKAEMDKKLAESEAMISSMERNRSDLEERLNKTASEITDLQEKSDQDRVEFENEKLRMQGEISRLRMAEEAARNNLGSVQKDCLALEARLQEARSDYERVIVAEAERIKSLQRTEAELAKFREEAAGLKCAASAAERNLQISQESWNNIKAKLEDQMKGIEKSNEDLKEQNKILHDQFQAMSSRLQTLQDFGTNPDAEGALRAAANSEKDMAEVIHYLRREKQILEEKVAVFDLESVRLRQQVDHLQRSLDETRAILDNERQKSNDIANSTRMHAELMEKINSMDVLRESNAELRSQNEINKKMNKMLDEKLRAKEAAIGPLKEENITLKAEVDAYKTEIKSLEEDNTRWKNRAALILSKYERIDPVEHQQLKDQIASLTAERDALTVSFDQSKAAIAASESNMTDLKAQLEAIQAKFSDLQNQSSTQSNSETALRTEIKRLTDQLRDQRKTLVADFNERGRERFAQAKRDVEEAKKEAAAVSAEKAALESELVAERARKDELSTRASLLESKISSLNSEISNLRNSAAGSPASRLVKLPVTSPSPPAPQASQPIARNAPSVQLDGSKLLLGQRQKVARAQAELKEPGLEAISSPSPGKRLREEEVVAESMPPGTLEVPRAPDASAPFVKRVKFTSDGSGTDVLGIIPSMEHSATDSNIVPGRDSQNLVNETTQEPVSDSNPTVLSSSVETATNIQKDEVESSSSVLLEEGEVGSYGGHVNQEIMEVGSIDSIPISNTPLPTAETTSTASVFAVPLLPTAKTISNESSTLAAKPVNPQQSNTPVAKPVTSQQHALPNKPALTPRSPTTALQISQSATPTPPVKIQRATLTASDPAPVPQGPSANTNATVTAVPAQPLAPPATTMPSPNASAAVTPNTVTLAQPEARTDLLKRKIAAISPARPGDTAVGTVLSEDTSGAPATRRQKIDRSTAAAATAVPPGTIPQTASSPPAVPNVVATGQPMRPAQPVKRTSLQQVGFTEYEPTPGGPGTPMHGRPIGRGGQLLSRNERNLQRSVHKQQGAVSGRGSIGGQAPTGLQQQRPAMSGNTSSQQSQMQFVGAGTTPQQQFLQTQPVAQQQQMQQQANAQVMQQQNQQQALQAGRIARQTLQPGQSPTGSIRGAATPRGGRGGGVQPRGGTSMGGGTAGGAS